MRYFLAPLVFILGLLCMKYTVQITNNTGKIDLAEKYFNTGIGAGTYTFWRLFGLGLCILSVLWILNKLPANHTTTPPPDVTSIIVRLMI
jgi:hypothetical protein